MTRTLCRFGATVCQFFVGPGGIIIMQQKIASFHLHRPETSVLACLAVVSGILMPAAGTAQSQSQAGRTAVEEIHVTASKRGYDESLQSVPMSIQALPERIMEQAGVKDFADFARL